MSGHVFSLICGCQPGGLDASAWLLSVKAMPVKAAMIKGLCEPVGRLCLIGMILSADLVGLPVPGAPHLVLDLSTGI